MNCPVCNNVNLLMSNRAGVEIDYCPNCRGVWLDRGELDKIIEQSQNSFSPKQNYQQQNHQQSYQQQNYQGEYGQDRRKYKKKESWLGEIFDF